MRKLLIGLVLASLAAAVLPGVAQAAAKPPKLQLAISNFRYCKTAPCTPLDAAYLRTDTGPVDGSDNSQAVINVKRGTTVVWTYRDSTCNAINGCPGHNIYFENGGAGIKKGFVPSNKGPKTIVVKISQKPGTTIRYFCTVNGHYMVGMTGVLHVT
jgi:plastocyanin